MILRWFTYTYYFARVLCFASQQQFYPVFLMQYFAVSSVLIKDVLKVSLKLMPHEKN